MVTLNDNAHWSYADAMHLLNTTIPFYQRDGKAAYKPDLSKAFKLAESLANPHQKFKSIHIGGTNGKGSVSHILASILQEAGFKTGLYTSPHLMDFRDRIKINGSAISEKEVTLFLEQNAELFKSNEASFFEVTTMMAFDHFARHEVDYAIIEVGLGGRLDTTNIIKPELSIITNINLDHTDILGETIPAIAREKAGIIKENIPVIIGAHHPESAEVFEQVAHEKKSRILFAEKVFQIEEQKTKFPYGQHLSIKTPDNQIIQIKTDLNGLYQGENIVTASVTLSMLFGTDFLNKTEFHQGLIRIQKNTGFMGRMQLLGTDPVILCDVAHNPDGLKPTMSQLASLNYKKLYMVVGIVQNKPMDEIFGLFPPDAFLHLAPLNIPRTEKVTMLEITADDSGHEYETYECIQEAYKAALGKANKNDLIFIGGSNFAVAEVLPKI